MKKIVKALSIIFAPLVFICTFLTACKDGKNVKVDNGEIMQDIDVKPTQTPAYEKYSRQAISDYKEIANRHRDKYGDIDYANEEVVKAANAASAKLFAYACYNERTLDQYVWFSDQTGGTDLGSMGSANVKKQDYYLRVNESANSCGYRYYLTYKWAKEYYGLVGSFKSAFEAARLRVTVDTDTMYRFAGDTGTFNEESYNQTLGCFMIGCDWKTKDDEWGVKDVAMVKEPFIAPEDIEEDINRQADDYYNDRQWSLTIHGNINILAKDMVKYSVILEDEETGCFTVVMNINTDVANSNEASVKMLTKLNGTAGDCNWQGAVDPDNPDASGVVEDTGLKIIFRIWDNGLFRSYTVIERWTGKIVAFNGTAESNICVNYSYSDRDCSMEKNLEMLEAAKKAHDSGNGGSEKDKAD